EASEREERERAAREAAERAVQREAAERAARDRATEEATAREAAEREAREAAEAAAREASEREERERAAREAAEAAAREASEREAHERAAREAAEAAAHAATEREAAERAAREAAERQATDAAAALAAESRRGAVTPAPPVAPPGSPSSSPSWRRRHRGPAEAEPIAARAGEPGGAVDLHVDEHRQGDDPSAAAVQVAGITEAVRLVADPPSVASPAGSSGGSTTSAIADPHRGVTPTGRSPDRPTDAAGARVAGVAPTPVKRYRPGAPPASPHIGARALPPAAVTGSTAPVGTPIQPWYRRAWTWVAVLAVAAVVATLGVVLLGQGGDGGGSSRLGGRPPAAAPRGTHVISGARFGIAAPESWAVVTRPGDTFPQLRRDDWIAPLVATDPATGQALLVAQLGNLAHQPFVDPDQFWSDQVADAGGSRTVSSSTNFGVHGYRATRVTVTDPTGLALEAAAIDTGDQVFLVAVQAKDADTADFTFQRLIQTFDPR
ncbi:MAG: hypothetical protein ACXV9S_12070, partial [Acidimicrobiia bacterium]